MQADTQQNAKCKSSEQCCLQGGLAVEPSAPDVAEGKLANEPSDYTYATVSDEGQAADQDLGEADPDAGLDDEEADAAADVSPSKQVRTCSQAWDHIWKSCAGSSRQQ